MSQKYMKIRIGSHCKIRLTLTLGQRGLYPLALFIPRSSWHFLSQEDFISGINYHGNVLSPDTFQHLGVLAFFIPGTFYPWKNLSPQTHGIFYPRNILSREYFITGILYPENSLSLEEFVMGRIYHRKNLSLEKFITGSFYHPGSLAHFISQRIQHLLGQDGNLPVYVIFDFDLRCSKEVPSASSTLDQSINKAEESTFLYLSLIHI